MPKSLYIKDDFLLTNEPARQLYHEFARELPIIDYHCHLPAGLIAEDHRFANLAEVWLAGDHYKWRLMRANGVPERYCTGDSPDYEKYMKWAETVPKCVRNPAYHWAHMELKRPFGIADRLFTPDTAPGIWEECNEKLAQPAFSARGIMRQMRVALVCTTDDPVDDLAAHRKIAADPDFDIRVLPTWRPDKALAVDDPAVFTAWVARLEAAAGMDCPTWERLLEALRKRQDFFHDCGCRIADHGLEVPHAADFTPAAVEAAYRAARDGNTPDADAALQYKSATLLELGRMNHAKGWAQQLHIGPIRNLNSRMAALLGPDTGYDSVGDAPFARPLAKYLDSLERTGQLAPTVLYTINPAANMVLATMTGNFQDGSAPGKMQFGSGWWFNDQMDGMIRQMEMLSQTGLLSRFVGMLTDSRSFLSYTRHEYFRRILCNMIGSDIANGLLPMGYKTYGELVRDVCYNNANAYFGFGLPVR